MLQLKGWSLLCWNAQTLQFAISVFGNSNTELDMSLPCPGTVTRASGGGTSTGSTAATSADSSQQQSIFSRLTSGGGLFGGLAAVLNTTSAAATTVTAYADSPSADSSAALSPAGANEVTTLTHLPAKLTHPAMAGSQLLVTWTTAEPF